LRQWRGNENSAAGFAFGIAGLRGVPGSVDVALRICGNGAAAIEAVRVSDDVAFGFEGGPGIVETSIKERGGSVGGELWRRHAGTFLGVSERRKRPNVPLTGAPALWITDRA